MTGRRTSYTHGGIKRVACARCGNKPSAHQWQICADGNLYRPICVACDLELNRLVLEFMGFPNVDGLVGRYAEALEEQCR